MKKFVFKEVRQPDDVPPGMQKPSGKIGFLPFLKGCLNCMPERGIDYSESRIRDEIEDAAKKAFDDNKKKYPFDLIVDDALAGHIQRVVKDARWVRRGDDIRAFLDAIDAVEDVEIKNGKVVKKK